MDTFKAISQVILILFKPFKTLFFSSLRFLHYLNCSFQDNGRIMAVQLLIDISINKHLNFIEWLSQNLLLCVAVLPGPFSRLLAESDLLFTGRLKF